MRDSDLGEYLEGHALPFFFFFFGGGGGGGGFKPFFFFFWGGGGGYSTCASMLLTIDLGFLKTRLRGRSLQVGFKSRDPGSTRVSGRFSRAWGFRGLGFRGLSLGV